MNNASKLVFNHYKSIITNKNYAHFALRSQLHAVKASAIFYLKPILNNSKANTRFVKELTDFGTNIFKMTNILINK